MWLVSASGTENMDWLSWSTAVKRAPIPIPRYQCERKWLKGLSFFAPRERERWRVESTESLRTRLGSRCGHPHSTQAKWLKLRNQDIASASN